MAAPILRLDPWRRAWALRLALGLMLALSGAAGALADAYRLVPGDTIEVSFAGLSDPVQRQIDMNGEIRLADIGGVAVGGLTADEAEDLIEQTLSDLGLFVDPQALVVIASYAPVVIAGAVGAPGKFDYFPLMTIEAALGLSGGVQSAAGLTRFEVTRARTDNAGLLREINTEIGAAVAKTARFEAVLAEAEVVALSPERAGQVPMPGLLSMDALLSVQNGILGEARQSGTALVALYDQEITGLEAQNALLIQRLQVQQQIVASAAADLANARELEARGLQTAAVVAVLEQREAEARSRGLDIETAQIATVRQIAETRRERSRFVFGRREDALIGLQEATTALNNLLSRYDRALQQQAVLSGQGLGMLAGLENFDVSYRILSARPGRQDLGAVSGQTGLLPGDTLIVSVSLTAGDR